MFIFVVHVTSIEAEGKRVVHCGKEYTSLPELGSYLIVFMALALLTIFNSEKIQIANAVMEPVRRKWGNTSSTV